MDSGKRVRSSVWGRLGRLGLVAAVAPLLSGCLFLELNGGYYMVSHDPPEGVPEADIKPGFGLGISAGAYIDIENTVRVSPGLGAQGHAAKPEDGGEGSATGAGFAGMVDVLPYELGDTTRLGGTLGVLIGKSTVTYTPPGGEELEDSSSALGFFLGGTFAWFTDDTDAILISLGPSYQSSSSDDAGSLSAFGPQLRIVIAGDLAGGDDSGSSDSGSGGHGELANAYCSDGAQEVVAQACSEAAQKTTASCDAISTEFQGVVEESRGEAKAILDGLMCKIYCALSREGASQSDIVEKGTELCYPLMDEVESKLNE